MQYIIEAFSVVSHWFEAVARWCKEYDGLGGWLGAVGAIIAIFVAWGLARSEYNKTRRASIEQKVRQIDMLQAVIFVAREAITNYNYQAQKSRNDAKLFYEQHQRDHELRLMDELSSLPLTGWPNPMLALSFRPYWQAAMNVLYSWREEKNFQSVLAACIKEYEKQSKELDEMFETELSFIKRADSF
jgi:hypothetical protein